MSNIRLADCEHTIEASDANLGDSRFNDVRLAGSRFSMVTMEGARFDNVHLDGSHFENVSLAGVAIVKSLYTGMTIEGIEVDALLALWREQQPAAAH